MSPEALLSWLSIAVYASAVLLALVAGGRVERAGAAICLANTLLFFAVQNIAGERLPYGAFLAIDVAAALALGVLALRAPERLWPGVAGVAQSMVIVFSATRALDFPLSEAAYAAALNLSSLAVGLSLAAGVVSHRWGRSAAPEAVAVA